MEPTVTIGRRGEARLRSGHPWIYRSDVERAEAPAGALVRVLSARGATLGRALWSDRSQIALRLLVRGETPLERDFVRRRLERAIARRRALEIDADAYRVVHAEADELPSLVVDRYGPFLAVQALSQGTDRLLAEIVDALGDLLRPEGIVARHDVGSRALEGLGRDVRVLAGHVPERVDVREGETLFELDLLAGQKTGLYLDQRENHALAARLARGRALDVFAYHGGFALALARRCESVVMVESSAAACERILLNAQRNGLANVLVEEANAFDRLRAADERGERFDVVVLDPPAFARNRAAVATALRGYKELNLRAMRVLEPGGLLVTATCSHHVDEHAFGRMLAEAAGDVGARMAVIERRGQALDHPVILGIPETGYLQCWFLRRFD